MDEKILEGGIALNSQNLHIHVLLLCSKWCFTYGSETGQTMI